MKTIKEVTNFSRFYTLLNRLPYAGNREDLKKQIVLQYTWNRTDHLHEMTRREYDDCCKGLGQMIPGHDDSWELYLKQIKRKRSAVLHQMQIYGVDTTEWSRVDNFCKNPKIAGKKFRELDGNELDALLVKLRIINRKTDKY